MYYPASKFAFPDVKRDTHNAVSVSEAERSKKTVTWVSGNECEYAVVIPSGRLLKHILAAE